MLKHAPDLDEMPSEAIARRVAARVPARAAEDVAHQLLHDREVDIRSFLMWADEELANGRARGEDEDEERSIRRGFEHMRKLTEERSARRGFEHMRKLAGEV